jgi:hypothetical protein
MPLNYPHSRTLLTTSQEQHVVLLETKNESNSLPETARVGEITTLHSRKDSRHLQNVSNKPSEESSKFTLKSP